MKIKVLDCTLRDGGYVNNWNFTERVIKSIVSSIVESKIEFCELGFLQNCDFTKDKTLYHSFDDLNLIYKYFDFKTCKPVVMVTYSKAEGLKFPKELADKFLLRVIFKKSEQDAAIDYCKELKSIGYKVFVNPMHTYDYSDLEFLTLIEKVNKINPFAFSIVDTNGIFTPNTLLNYVRLADKNLKSNINLGFHGHNNLQLALANAMTIADFKSQRTSVIDVSLLGMGRGAGNLNSELFLSQLNSTNYKYNLFSILNCLNDDIEPIKVAHDWGYNVTYYLSSMHKCHPNYAKYLLEKQNLSSEALSKILELIPEIKRSGFDQKFIENLYNQFIQNNVDDSDSIEFIKQKIGNQKVLILAPGKSLLSQQSTVNDFIKNDNPITISINFVPEEYDACLSFFSNQKRYDSYFLKFNGCFKEPCIVTSNLDSTQDLKLNFSSYLFDSKYGDTSLLLLLNVLKKSGTKKIYLAGCDGYDDHSSSTSYTSDFLGHSYFTDNTDKQDYNKEISKALSFFSKDLDISFVTESNYKIEQ